MIAAKEIVDMLNRMMSIDPSATAELVSNRVECSDSLARGDSPFVCCVGEDGFPRIGMVGVLNALALPSSGRVAAVYDDVGNLTSFMVVGI